MTLDSNYDDAVLSRFEVKNMTKPDPLIRDPILKS